jgi:hypothetical protein
MNSSQLLEAVDVFLKVQSLFSDPMNPLLPVYAAIGGAFVGSVSTFLPNYLLESSRKENEKKSIQNAIISEINALLKIIQYRKYINGISNIVDNLKNNSNGICRYRINVPEHYSRVYQKHVDRIGLLDSITSSKIIEFYQLLDAIVQDVCPGGIICEQGGNYEQFLQLKNIAEEAMLIGKELVSNYK